MTRGLRGERVLRSSHNHLTAHNNHLAPVRLIKATGRESDEDFGVVVLLIIAERFQF